jgi:DNA-binding winged helix-turn-helix (wHTH) protein
VIDPDRFELRRAGSVEHIEPQVFDVLVYLVEHRDRVVTKGELLDSVWGDRFVSSSSLTSRLKSLRRAVGDDGAAQRVIRTVLGRGYQFVAPVVERDHSAGAVPAVSPMSHPPPPPSSSPLLQSIEGLASSPCRAATTSSQASNRRGRCSYTSSTTSSPPTTADAHIPECDHRGFRDAHTRVGSGCQPTGSDCGNRKKLPGSYRPLICSNRGKFSP